MNWMKIFRRNSDKRRISKAHSLEYPLPGASTDLQVSAETQPPTKLRQESDPVDSAYQSPDTWSADATTQTTTTVRTTTTVTPRLGDDVDEETREKETALLQAWRKNTERKMLPIPSDYPDYMRDEPKMPFAETETYLKRKEYNLKRIESYDAPAFHKNPQRIKPGPKPKLNKTYELRKNYTKKEPILSQHFQRHFEAYRRAPFQTSKLKLSTT